MEWMDPLTANLLDLLFEGRHRRFRGLAVGLENRCPTQLT